MGSCSSHFLSVDHVDEAFFLSLHQRALNVESDSDFSRQHLLKHEIVANIFLEASTRTMISFECALHRLGAQTVRIDAHTSSLSKNESLYDTLLTLRAMGIRLFVIRSSNSRLEDIARTEFGNTIHMINAGDGSAGHPTQAMLDASVLLQQWGHFSGKTLAIIGDVNRSRVARSNVALLCSFGVNVNVYGPPDLLPTQSWHTNMNVCRTFEEATQDADAVMMLRVQQERNTNQKTFNLDGHYLDRYGMTLPRLESLKKDAWLMHPGPTNRGVELQSELVEHPRSLISKQVSRGVSMRMAIVMDLMGVAA
ncbi:MAG: aspartate carbamoyltransferase catalytic subunit [Bdellovibrionota bacterium]